MTLEITSEARQDLQDAYDWYEDQKTGLGDQFVSQFKAACKSVIKSPEGYQSIRTFRQIPLKRFPFLVLYDLIDGKIVVFGVFHTRKNPDKKNH